VLTASHRHYGSELRLVAEASRSLVEKLMRLDTGGSAASLPLAGVRQGIVFPVRAEPVNPFNLLRLEPMSMGLIDDLREELLSGTNLLDAIAGPNISVTVAAQGGAVPVALTSENLIRALVNLVKNASGFIRGTGTIQITMEEARDKDGAVGSLVISIVDSGSGIPDELLERVFEPGFSNRPGEQPDARWESGHRGLGLSITRSIVQAAGGRIHAESKAGEGARFVIELPVRGR
jgi:signal transduction histidine kinase